jgi:hypothetical protein
MPSDSFSLHTVRHVRIAKNTEAALRGQKMARRENCLQCLIATAANNLPPQILLPMGQVKRLGRSGGCGQGHVGVGCD